MTPRTHPAYEFQWENSPSAPETWDNKPLTHESVDQPSIPRPDIGAAPWSATSTSKETDATPSYAPLTQENVEALKKSTQAGPESTYPRSATSSDRYLIDSERHLRARHAIAYYTMHPTRDFGIHKWLHAQRDLIQTERVQDPKLQEWLMNLRKSCGDAVTSEVEALRDRLEKTRRRVADRAREAERSRQRLEAKNAGIRQWLEEVRVAHPPSQEGPPSWMSQFDPTAWAATMQQTTGHYVPLPDTLDDPQ